MPGVIGLERELQPMKPFERKRCVESLAQSDRITLGKIVIQLGFGLVRGVVPPKLRAGCAARFARQLQPLARARADLPPGRRTARETRRDRERVAAGRPLRRLIRAEM